MALAPVVGLPVVGFPGPGVDSPCGGGVLTIRNEAWITEANSNHGGSGDPYEQDPYWSIMTVMELVKC